MLLTLRQEGMLSYKENTEREKQSSEKTWAAEIMLLGFTIGDGGG